MAKTSRAKTLTYIKERIDQIKGVFCGNPDPDLIEHLNIEMEVLHAAKSALDQLDKVVPPKQVWVVCVLRDSGSPYNQVGEWDIACVCHNEASAEKFAEGMSRDDFYIEAVEVLS